MGTLHPRAISITDVRWQRLQTIGTLRGSRERRQDTDALLEQKMGWEMRPSPARDSTPRGPVICMEQGTGTGSGRGSFFCFCVTVSLFSL